MQPVEVGRVLIDLFHVVAETRHDGLSTKAQPEREHEIKVAWPGLAAFLTRVIQLAERARAQLAGRDDESRKGVTCG